MLHGDQRRHRRGEAASFWGQSDREKESREDLGFFYFLISVVINDVVKDENFRLNGVVLNGKTLL